MINTKKWYQSWTIWINLVTFLSLALELMKVPPFSDLFTPAFLLVMSLIVNLLTILIRVFRNQGPIEKSIF